MEQVAARLAIVVAGLAATGIGVAGGFFLFVFAVIYGCGGSDASAPSTSAYCTSGLDPELPYVVMFAGVLAPLVGTIVAATRQRWHPLLIGIAIEAVAAIAGIYVVSAA